MISVRLGLLVACYERPTDPVDVTAEDLLHHHIPGKIHLELVMPVFGQR
jgi:hypothetical protein